MAKHFLFAQQWPVREKLPKLTQGAEEIVVRVAAWRLLPEGLVVAKRSRLNHCTTSRCAVERLRAKLAGSRWSRGVVLWLVGGLSWWGPQRSFTTAPGQAIGFGEDFFGSRNWGCSGPLAGVTESQHCY